MALSNRKVLGVSPTLGNKRMLAMTFDEGQTFINCQENEAFPLRITPRGRGICLQSNFVREPGITDADIAALVATDDYGVNPPTNFQTPAGWIKEYDKDTGATTYVYKKDVDAYNAGDTDGDGKKDGRNANIFDSVMTFVKDNPLTSAAIAVAVYLFIIRPLFAKGKGKKKGLLAGIF